MSDDPRACPTCRAWVPAAAERCPECREPLAPSPPPDGPQARGAAPPKVPKWKRAPSVAAPPPPADAVPCFAVIQPWNIRPNRSYWVYVTGGELVGLYAGAGPDLGPWDGRSGAGRDRNARRQAALAPDELRAFRGDHHHNFALAAGEIARARLTPAGWWFRMNNPTLPRVGLLRLAAPRGPWLFAFPTDDDRDTAAELLGALLADKLEVTGGR